MERKAPLRIGITIGDPGGIGPEVALKAITRFDHDIDFRLIGPGALWAFHALALAKTDPTSNEPIRDALARAIIMESPDPKPREHPQLGSTNTRNGSVAAAAIREAVLMCQDGVLDAIVTAPLSKGGLKAAGIKHPGHTEMLQELTKSPSVGMLLAGGGLRVSLATIHVPLRRVFDLLTPELILHQGHMLATFLHQWLGQPPRIAVCGLNPHAGEGGMFGDEEARIITPAIDQLRAQGINVTGPHPADTVFHDALQGAHDGILAMYHDQGLGPLKTVAFDQGVNITMGLPIIRTSPDHGTAFGIAGRSIARPDSMVAAINAACSLVDARRRNHV